MSFGIAKKMVKWEKSQVDILMNELGNSTIDMRKLDECVWEDSKTNIYMVKWANIKIRKQTMGEDTNLYGQFWNIKSSPRTLHFS